MFFRRLERIIIVMIWRSFYLGWVIKLISFDMVFSFRRVDLFLVVKLIINFSINVNR